jgi:hypothetical protein
MKTKVKNTLNLLLSGKHPQIKKYAGKYVFVGGSEVVPMKEGEGAWKDFETLEKKYHHPPHLNFCSSTGNYLYFAMLIGRFPFTKIGGGHLGEIFRPLITVLVFAERKQRWFWPLF